MIQRFLTALFSFAILLGCKSTEMEIKSANKQSTVPGRPNGTFGANFSAILKVNEDIQIDSVSIGDASNSKNFSTFQVYKLSDGTILNPKQVLTTGEYQVRVSSSEKLNDLKNAIHINYTANGKSKSVQAEIINKGTLYMK
ncbi:hypothetical protein [Tenacibaculum agarivorans]|uniref:hypothetical protein n=1 Tax=Tenacibaculum agarivorans TaxID=1908389 RepID=UPI00094B9563|nr:hypothetical protein [Tenacibaculum agarivorans]